MKTASSTIDIDALPAEVRAVLKDLAAYPQWDPLFPQASGQIAVGERLTLAGLLVPLSRLDRRRRSGLRRPQPRPQAAC